ncbi:MULTISPECIES: sulfite oxidase [unclassified Thioalkalivibrio]|uniref:sulfite oxidase n=1 Tax=unclassified Thioalkalivibrio TaxID=2621013 RepID=UPI0003816781|nr:MULTISPECIES: sulfite oxidase [unclassified Thioalkalivibrio]
MTKKQENQFWDRLRGVTEDAGADPQTLEIFDEAVSRRRFMGRMGVGGAALTLFGFGAGTDAAMRGLFGRGLIPAAWADEANGLEDEQAKSAMSDAGKEDGLIVHNDRPLNVETPPHLLEDEVTPASRHFIRNNDLIPQQALDRDPNGWSLKIDGEVHEELEIGLDDLKSMDSKELVLHIECGGNGRANFDPQPRGNPWDRGAVGNARWTGVPLKDILERAGVKDSAVYTAHEGYEPILGDRGPFSRGVPIDKAMEEHTIVAYQMNGEDIPAAHGFPVRLVVPGWYGSCSHKWLTNITLRDQEHDGRGMTGYSYRMPKYPVAPGERPPEEDMKVGGPWLIKSVITGPKKDTGLERGETVKVTGHAWAGEDEVAEVWISTDFGLNWEKADLKGDPVNKYAWVHFEKELSFENRGYYEIWARAVDDKGNTQPIVQPWNPRGYDGNIVHKIPVTVAA